MKGAPRMLSSERAAMITGLEKELATYEVYRSELLASALGKFVLIKGDRVVGVFGTWEEAADHGYEELGRVAFLVKEILEIERVETL